jgi:hypothetical protein
MATTSEREFMKKWKLDLKEGRKLLPTLDSILSDDLIEFLYRMEKKWENRVPDFAWIGCMDHKNPRDDLLTTLLEEIYGNLYEINRTLDEEQNRLWYAILHASENNVPVGGAAALIKANGGILACAALCGDGVPG